MNDIRIWYYLQNSFPKPAGAGRLTRFRKPESLVLVVSPAG